MALWENIRLKEKYAFPLFILKKLLPPSKDKHPPQYLKTKQKDWYFFIEKKK